MSVTSSATATLDSSHHGGHAAVEIAGASPRRAVGRPSERLLAALAVLGPNTIWGTSIVTSRMILADVPPLTLTVLRATIAIVILLPLVYRAGERPARRPLPALMGLTGLALFYPAFYGRIRQASAANAALIVDGGIPVLTALLAAITLRERPAPLRLLGILGSALGVCAIAVGGRMSGLDVSILGNLLLCAAAVFAVFTVAGRRVYAQNGLLAATSGSLIYGTLLLLPAAGVELATVGLERFSLADAALLLYLGADSAGLAFVLLGYGLRRLEASVVRAFGNVAPLVGVLAAVMIRHESLSPFQIGSGVLIGGGIWLAARANA